MLLVQAAPRCSSALTELPIRQWCAGHAGLPGSIGAAMYRLMEITDLCGPGKAKTADRATDTREDPAIPPFGFVTDYLTYGGLQPEVWLEATAESRLTDLFVYTPTLHDAVVQWTAELAPAAVAVRIRLETADGTLLAQQTAQAAETGKMQLSVPDAQPWDTEHPVLHHAIAELLNAAGQPIDRKQVTFGFRTAEFRADGFYLNAKRPSAGSEPTPELPPYIGYAALESLQRGMAFCRRSCTALPCAPATTPKASISGRATGGVWLVFTELPGWQHIGDDNWKDAACEMLQEMPKPQSPQHHPVGCASTRAWTTMPSMPAPTKCPSANSQPCHLRRAVSGKKPSAGVTFTLTTIFPTTA